MSTNTANFPELTSDQYQLPDVYLGEVIQPNASSVSADARIPAIIAKGSRYAIAQNVPVLRSFIKDEALDFTQNSPFIASLQHVSDGNVQLPTRIYTADGNQLAVSQWKFVLDGNGKNTIVQINSEVFDQTASYLMDYQSTDPSVLDVIPINNLRAIRAVGVQLSRAQFFEYTDFFVPDSFTSVMPSDSNINKVAFFSSVEAATEPGSTGTCAISAAASYTHPYSRAYQLVCTSSSGPAGERIATFNWSATPLSGGNTSAAPVPLASSDLSPSFEYQEAVPGTDQPELEFGVKPQLGFGVSNFEPGDTFSFTANGPSLFEIDLRYNSTQFASIGTPAVQAGAENDMLVQVDPSAVYNGARNNTIALKLVEIANAMNPGSRVFTFAWARYGDILPVQGNFVMEENIPASQQQFLTNGVQINFVIGPIAPEVGTLWTLQLQAPQIYFTGKDSRKYVVTIGNLVVDGTQTILNGGYTTNTTEGSFGTFTAEFDPANFTNADGYTVLPDTMSLAFRNFPSLSSLDAYTFGVSDSGFMDWNLQMNSSDVREITDFRTDQNGAITGTAGTTYVILSDIPSNNASIRVQNYNTGDNLSFLWNIGTPYVYFTANPNVPVLITYLTASNQPAPGQTYYITAEFLRDSSFYNNPYLVMRLVDGQSYAAPSAVDNDLYVGNQIFWANAGSQAAVYLVQAQNLDGSGVFSETDYDAAIDSCVNSNSITDLCLLNFPDALQEALEQNQVACDPFQKRSNLVWVGAAIGTPIGDVNTIGTLVYTAQNTLQVSGQSPAKGTRILVGPTQASLTVVLDSGQSASITVDGSFVALAGAALVASFTDPATDIFEESINGFDSIQVYNDDQNRTLGANGICFVNGSPGSYTWGEDLTVDPSSNFNRIQLMTQRQFVVRYVTRNLKPLLGITPDSTSAALTLIQGQLATILRTLVSQGLIAPYQNADGTTRQFDPNVDLAVWQDQDDLTLFYYNFAWYSRNVIKRLYGLYSLNSNDFSTGTPLEA